jgi:hypothetical protein
MILGAPRVTLSALAELRQLLIGRVFRRSSVRDPTIVQQETRWRRDAGMKARGRGGSAVERSDGCELAAKYQLTPEPYLTPGRSSCLPARHDFRRRQPREARREAELTERCARIGQLIVERYLYQGLGVKRVVVLARAAITAA